MANNSSAGVYVEEKDLSQRASPPSTSIAAVVGASRRGPVNQRTLVTSVQKFIDLFGIPDPTLGFMHYAALAYLNEGNRLLVTRVAPGSLYAGARVFKGDTNLNEMESWNEGQEDPTIYDFAPQDLFVVYAANQGKWADGLQVRLYPDTILNDGSFYVEVYEAGSGIAVERHNVHLNYKIDGYGVQKNIQEYINKRSSYIRIEQNYEQADYKINPDRVFISALTQIALAGGDDGTKPTTGEYMQAWDLYRDPEKVDVRILVNAGLTNPAIQMRMAEIAEDRMDCIAILDTPSTEQKVQDAIDFRRSTLNLNSSYAALYSCDVFILDEYNRRRLYVPPSGHVAGAYAKTDRDFATWFAPAGLVRGKLSVLGVRHIYNQGDRDALAESQVNAIRNIEGSGIAIWGADTLQTMASALSNVNVRRLMIYMEKALSDASLYSVFNPNDEILRSRLVEMCTRFLQPIQDGRGLYWFGVTCDETNNPPETVAAGDLFLDVGIDPVLPAKRIILRAVINKTGARFTTGANANG